MSRVSKVSIALRLITAVVTAHVMSVESKAKINIGVNGIHVMSVESFRKDNGYLSVFISSCLDLRMGENELKTGHPELKLYYKRQTVSNPSLCILHVVSVENTAKN